MKSIVLALLFALVIALTIATTAVDAASNTGAQGLSGVPRDRMLKGKRGREARDNVRRFNRVRKEEAVAPTSGADAAASNKEQLLNPFADRKTKRERRSASRKKAAEAEVAAGPKKKAMAASSKMAGLAGKAIKNPRDKLVRAEPRVKGPRRADSSDELPPTPNPWYHGSDFGYTPYGHTAITNWNVPKLDSAGAVAYFRTAQMMVRVDNTYITFVNTTTGAYSTSFLDCVQPQYVIRANATVGYYACADGTIALFEVEGQQTLSVFRLPADNQGYNYTDYPYAHDDEEVLFEYVPHLQQNMLLIQVQNQATRLEAAQIITLTSNGTVESFGPILGAGCGKVTFVGLTQQAAAPALSALMVCASGDYYAFSDPSVSGAASFQWATKSVVMRATPNIQTLSYPPGYPGPFFYYIKSVAFAYLDEANLPGPLTVTEISTDASYAVKTTPNIPRQQGACGNPNTHAMQGPAMVLSNVFIFTTVCGMFGFDLAAQTVLYSLSPGNDMQYLNLFWGGAGEGTTSAGVVMESVVDTTNTISVFTIANGALIYRNNFAATVTGITHATTHVLYKPPGFALPLDSKPLNIIGVLTTEQLIIVDIDTGIAMTTLDLRTPALLPPVWMPDSNSIVVVGGDNSIISYGTSFGIAYYSDAVPTIHNGVVYVAAVAEDYNTYVFALDQAGRVMWRSDRAFGFAAVTHGMLHRYVMVAESPNVAFLDMYTGATVDVIAINTNCDGSDPRLAGAISELVHSADGTNVYFTAGTKCLYNIGQDLTLTGYAMPFRSANAPVLDNTNNYAFVYDGYSVAAFDMSNNGAQLFIHTLDNMPLGIVPLSESMNTVNYPGYKPEFVYVLCEFGLYALYYPTQGTTQWSYLVRNGSMTDKVVSNLLVFNQAAYIKYGNTIAKISLDPSLAYADRILWTAAAVNADVLETTNSERLVATALGAIIWVGGNDIKVFDSVTGATIIDKTDSCPEGAYGSVFSYDKWMNALAVSCSDSVFLYNMTTGKEVIGLLQLPNAQAVSLRDGVLIASNGLQVFVQAIPAYLLPDVNYFNPLPTVAPAGTFAPLPSGAAPIPPPTLSPPVFSGLYNAPPPFVANMTSNTMVTELKWNMIFSVPVDTPNQIVAQSGFTFATEWTATVPYGCTISQIYPVGLYFLNGILLVSCQAVVNDPAAANVLYAVNAKTGAKVWEELDIVPTTYYNVAGDALLVVGSGTSTLTAFTLTSGQKLWTTTMAYAATSSLIMTTAVDGVNNVDYLIYIDTTKSISAIVLATGASFNAYQEGGCGVVSPVLVAGQQTTTYLQRNLTHLYYMCDSDLKRWAIQSNFTEDLVTFEGPDATTGLYFTTNNGIDIPLMMVALTNRFDVYTVEPDFVQLYSYNAPTGETFFGNSAFLAEKNLAIATYGNPTNFNVNFVALDVSNTSDVKFAWSNSAGAYNYLVVSSMMASATQLPDATGNFVYLNGAVFVMNAETGSVNTQFQGNYVSVSFPDIVNQSFIEGPDYVTQTQTRIVVGSETIAALIIVDPMLDNSPDAYGWSYSGTVAKGFESYTDCVTNEHFTIAFDDDGIVSQLDDAGYVRWTSNGLADNSAPLNIFAVAYVRGDLGTGGSSPNGYIALINDHGVTFLKASDGTFVVELQDLIAASLTKFAATIQYLAWGDSVYVASNDFVFRFDPFAQKMTFLRVATYPMQYVTAIGSISLDGSMIVLNTNLGGIVAVNTTDMATALTASFTALGSPVTGFAPSCANRTAVRRGAVDPSNDFFITYSEPTATFAYYRYSDLMVLQMMNEVPAAVFMATDDCALLVWSQWVMAKFDNALVNQDMSPVWAYQVSFDGETTNVQFALLPNVGLVALCGANGEYFTIDYQSGAQIAHFTVPDVTIVYSSFFSVAGQGVNTPLVADAIFVDTDYGGAFVRATTGELISKMLDSNMDIVVPTTPTTTYLYLEFGTLLTINPVPLAGTPVDPALGLQPVATKTIGIPNGYAYDLNPVITTPFTPEYTNASFAMRIWAEPAFNQSIDGIHYAGSFVFSYNDFPTIAAVVTVVGKGFLQFRDAVDGEALVADVPISYDGEQAAHWVGMLSSNVGGYCVAGNMLVGFPLKNLSNAGTQLFSTQLPASVLLNPPYPNSDVPNVPIVNLMGDSVACMLLTDAKAVCVNTETGALLVNFNCPANSMHFGPIFTDPMLNLAVFSCMAIDDTQTFTMTAYDVTTPAAPKWVSTDNSGTVAGVDGTTNYMVVFVATPTDGSGAYMVSFATGQKGASVLVPDVVIITATDGWEQDAVYAVFSGRDSQDASVLWLVCVCLSNQTVLWKKTPPSMVPFEMAWGVTSIVSTLDKHNANWVSVMVFNTGAVCSFDVDTGANDWCIRTDLAITAPYLEMYEEGFLLWGAPDTNVVEFRNLVDPTQTWVLSTNNDYSDLAHSLYTFVYNDLTFIHRAFSSRIASYVVQTERSVIFPNYAVADSLTQRFVVLTNPSDGTLAVYDSLDEVLLWGVNFFSRATTSMVITPALYAPNDVPTTVLLAYTNDAIIGLSATDGALSFVVSVPFCRGGLSPIQSSYWDEAAGFLYIGYDTCLLSVSAADGSYTMTDLGSFVGSSILTTEHCLIVVSLFGDITCFGLPVNGVVSPTPVWIDSVGVYTSDFDINQYGSFIVLTWTDNQVMLSEATGQRVFERNTKDVDVDVEIWSNFLVMASDDGITVLDLSLNTPADKRAVLTLSAEYLVPAPLTDNYLSPSRPVIMPWGVAVAEVRQRIFGIDLTTMSLVFNETSYSTVESLKQTPCNYLYVPPTAAVNATWEMDIQKQVMTCDGNTYSAVTGATFTQAPPLTFTFANKGALFPNGQSVSEYVIAGYSEGTYISELPFSYLKFVALSAVPTDAPTATPPSGTLDPNFVPQTQYSVPAALPAGVTMPDNGCVLAIENQRRLYDACVEQIILLQQRAGTAASAQCADIATALTTCATNWIDGMPPDCAASTQYLAVAAQTAKASPAFPWCSNATSCADANSAAVCAALDTTIAYNNAGTAYPGYTIPAPAGQPPVYSSMAPPTMPAEAYKYFSFHAVAVQGKERQAVDLLPAALMGVLGLAEAPQLSVGNHTMASTFDFYFVDDSIAYAYSSVLAQKIVDNYGTIAADLGLVAISFATYGPVDPPTPPPTTSALPTTAGPTTAAPTYTPPAQLVFYRFHCNLFNGPIPNNLDAAIGDLLNLNYDPQVTLDNVTFSTFDFEFTTYNAAGTLSGTLYNLIQADSARVAAALGVAAIQAIPYTPSLPTTLPPSPEDSDDARPALSGIAAAGLAILVIIAAGVGGLLVYVFVIKGGKSASRYNTDDAQMDLMTEAV